MSVQELRFKEEFELAGEPRVNKVKFAFINDKLVLTTRNGKTREGKKILNQYRLDRNQAHLLMLYLQEHLANAVPTVPKELWECGCGKWHAKDFVCEQLNGN